MCTKESPNCNRDRSGEGRGRRETRRERRSRETAGEKGNMESVWTGYRNVVQNIQAGSWQVLLSSACAHAPVKRTAVQLERKEA